MLHLAPLAVCTIVLGCMDSEHQTMRAARIDTIAGVIHVRNGAPLAFDSVEVAALIGRRGDLGEITPYEFGRITSATVSWDGRLLVADDQAHEVRVFSGTGKFIKAFGREGAGPGEFGALYSLTWLGDSLLVLDSKNARISVFDDDGKYIATWPWLPIIGPESLVRFYQTMQGEAYVFGLRPISDGQSIRTFVRLTHSGAVDTLEAPPAESRNSNALVCPRGDGQTSFFGTPFAGRRLITPAPNGLFAVAWSENYRIAIVSPARDTVRVIERDFNPLTITDEEWQVATADFQKFRQEWPGSRCNPQDMKRPEHQQALRGLYFDTDGRLIVEVAARGSTRYDVFDERGRAVASIRTLERDQRVAPYFRPGQIVQIVQDSLGVQYIALVLIQGELATNGRNGTVPPP